jgi:hypothetical protein
MSTDMDTVGETRRDTAMAKHQPLPAPARLLLFACACLWLIGVAYGVNVIREYESAPGAMGIAPDRWPDESRIVRDSGRSTLLMLVHPRCSCTRASLDELRGIMNRPHGAVSAWVIFIKPSGMDEGWERSATWAQARAIPNVTVLLDDGGLEAKRFGALTSGHVVLYDRTGRLVFSGGITGARGHEGDNVGTRRVLGLLDQSIVARTGHDVFGCPL